MSPKDEEVRITLRLPVNIRDLLVEAAKLSGRSMNAEIVARIEDSFVGEEKLWDEVNRLAELIEGVSSVVKDIEPKVDCLWRRSEP